MKCDAYKILISQLEDGSLNADESELVRQHLETCENCQAYDEGRRATAESQTTCDARTCEAVNGLRPAAKPAQRSWGWAVVVLFGLAALVALILFLGPGRWSHGSAPHHRAGFEEHTVWRTR